MTHQPQNLAHQIPTILLTFETRFTENQAIQNLVDLLTLKESLIKSNEVSFNKHYKEYSPLELSYVSIDYLIAIMYSNIKPSSEESFFLQSYHYNLFMKFVCDIQLGLKNVYDSILTGTIQNHRSPQVPKRTRRNNGVDYNNRGYWENRLRDMIHETIPKLTNYSIQCVTLGFPLDFSYVHYS